MSGGTAHSSFRVRHLVGLNVGGGATRSIEDPLGRSSSDGRRSQYVTHVVHVSSIGTVPLEGETPVPTRKDL